MSLVLSRKLNPIWTRQSGSSDIIKEDTAAEHLLWMCFLNAEEIESTNINQGIKFIKPSGKLVIVENIPEEDEILFPIHELRRKRKYNR